MNDSIKKEQLFSHPIQKIWKAITQADELTTWFIKADFKPEIGYHYTFSSTGENGCTEINGEIKQAHPYTLEYTWVVANTNVETTVTWKLEETNEGTLLRLEHSGISKYDGDTAVQMFTSFDGGWDNCLSGLTNHLSTMVDAG